MKRGLFIGTGITGAMVIVAGIAIRLTAKKKVVSKTKEVKDIKIDKAEFKREIDDELRAGVMVSKNKETYKSLEKKKNECIDKVCKTKKEVEDNIKNIKHLDRLMMEIEANALSKYVEGGLKYKGIVNHMCDDDVDYKAVRESKYGAEYLVLIREKNILAEQRASGKDTYDDIIQVNRKMVAIQDKVLGEKW